MTKFLHATSMLAMVAATATAYAQDAARLAAVGTAAAVEAGIGDIIVTASRREETLQRTALPVTAISADELMTKGVSSITEITKMQAAVKIGQGAGSGIQLTVRGVGSFGGNVFAEPGVAVNLDGVYLARGNGPFGIFYDVARVEVLKGPQGTLYGRNTTGGVVNVITRDPTNELGGNATLEIGNYDLVRGTAALNVPVSDTLSLRVAGQGVTRNGYLSDGYNDDKEYSGRAKLLFRPNERFSLLLEADYTKIEGKGSNAVFVPYVVPGEPYVGPSDPRSNAVFSSPLLPPTLPRITPNGFLDNTNYGFQGTAKYAMDFAETTLTVANRTTTAHYLHYSAGFPVGDDIRGDPSRTTTAELRIGSKGDGRLKWVIGAFYFADKLHTKILPDQGASFARPDVKVRTKSYSGFGEGTFALAEHFRLTAGGRYTSDDKAISGSTTVPVSGQVPPPAYPLVCPAVQGAVLTVGQVSNPAGTVVFPATCTAPVAGADTFRKFTWKAGVEADVGEHSLLYASVSTGFKAGGFYSSLNTAPAGQRPNNEYAPEKMTAYTVGAKNRFFGNTLQVNVEGFYWDYKNKQVPHLGIVQPGNGLNLIVDNAASAEIYGAELESLWEPTPRDTFSLGVQYLHARYKDFSYNVIVPGFAGPGFAAAVPATGCTFSPVVGLGGAPGGRGVFGSSTVNCSGKDVPFSPEFTGNAAYHHVFDLSGGSTIVPGVSTHIEAPFELGEEYLPGQRQTASMVSDADLTWNSPDKRYSVTAFIQNIENKAVGGTSFVQPTLGRPLILLRAPRTFGGRINIAF